MRILDRRKERENHALDVDRENNGVTDFQSAQTAPAQKKSAYSLLLPSRNTIGMLFLPIHGPEENMLANAVAAVQTKLSSNGYQY